MAGFHTEFKEDSVMFGGLGAGVGGMSCKNHDLGGC